jgi:hypothetical protein
MSGIRVRNAFTWVWHLPDDQKSDDELYVSLSISRLARMKALVPMRLFVVVGLAT